MRDLVSPDRPPRPSSRRPSRRGKAVRRAAPDLSPAPCRLWAIFKQNERFIKILSGISGHFRALIWVQWSISYSFLLQYRQLCKTKPYAHSPYRAFRAFRTLRGYLSFF